LLPFDGATLARLASAGALPFLPAAAFVRIQPSSVGAGYEVAPLLSPPPPPARDASAWNVSPSVDENQNSKRHQSDNTQTVTTRPGASVQQLRQQTGDARLPHTADQNLIVLALAAAAQHRKELEDANSATLQHDLSYSQDAGSLADDDSDDGDTGTVHGGSSNGFVTAGRHHPRVRSMIAGEHRQTLKEFYRVNPRPSKAELEQLLSRISFPKRVVQVWFQNMRARDRRKARIAAATGLHRGTDSSSRSVHVPGPDVSSWIKTQDEPLDLSRRDARPPSNTSLTMTAPRQLDVDASDEQVLNLSTRRREDDAGDKTDCCDKMDSNMDCVMEAAGGASSPAGSVVSVKSENWSAPSTADNDDADMQLDLLANGSLTDVSHSFIVAQLEMLSPKTN